jgi:hypothetical protein
MTLEKAAYVILAILVLAWVALVVSGLVLAFPFGLVGFLVIVAFGLLFIKVILERIRSKEDSYYDKNIDI